MSAGQTYEIQDWNPKTQTFEPKRRVTLAQFRAEQDARNAAALNIYRAGVAALKG